MYNIFLSLACGLFLVPSVVFAQELPIENQEVFPQQAQIQFVRGTVNEVLSEEEQHDELFGLSFLIQQVEVNITEKGYEGENPVYVNFESTLDQDARKVDSGDKVVIGIQSLGEDVDYFISDVYRLHMLWFMLAFFLVLAVVFAGTHGIRAVIGLIISFGVIFRLFIPQVIAGSNPFLLAIIMTLLIAATTVFLAHGYNKRTRIAFFAILITIGLSIIIAQLAVGALHLTGIGSEEAFLLQFSELGSVSLKGLLLGGIIISVLGVLDDVTTAQAAAIEQISKANKELGVKELYIRGMEVGKEHIISLINTLVLAYTGASLPLLLLFKLNEQPLWVVLNSEIIIEEVARVVVGSIALLLAVPITSVLAAYGFGTKTDK